MIYGKSLKISKRTMTLTLESSDQDLCNLDRYEFVSLSLLHGFFNPLRKYSKTTPIDLNKLDVLKNKYSDLIKETIGLLDIDVEEIEKL